MDVNHWITKKAVLSGTYKDVDWAVTPGPSGSPNGYFLIPENHPWRVLTKRTKTYGSGRKYNLGSDKINALIWDDYSSWRGEQLIGGAAELTYSDRDGWVGFDTQHLCDEVIDWTPELVEEQLKCWIDLLMKVGGTDGGRG